MLLLGRIACIVLQMWRGQCECQLVTTTSPTKTDVSIHVTFGYELPSVAVSRWGGGGHKPTNRG